MRFFFIFITAFFLKSILASQAVANTLQQDSAKIVFLGDSLTEGYGVSRESAFPQLIQKKINDKKLNWKVVNSGVSGSTSASAESRLDWIFKGKPQIIVLALGANDGLRGINPNETYKNLKKAIEKIKGKNIRVILAGIYMPPNYGKKYTEDFRSTFIRLSKEYKITFVPFLLDEVAGKSDLNLPDGIHPNERGHQIIADRMFPLLEKELQ